MSVVLTRTPDPYALTRSGRMVYGFSGSGRYASRGITYLGRLIAKGAIPVGTILNLTWNNTLHRFSFVANPQAPDELPAGDAGAAHYAQLIAVLRTSYALREDFIITSYDPASELPAVVFQARQPGKAYTLSTEIGLTNLFFTTTERAGGDALLRIRYSVYAELWVQKPGTPGLDKATDFSRVFRVPVETDADGVAEFDAGPILHAQLLGDWPHWNTTTPVAGTLSQTRYFVAYGEAYGEPFQIGRVADGDIYRAYLGGADYQHRAGGGYRFLAYRTDHPAADAALRAGGLLRYVHADEPQYLTFLNSRADAAVSLLIIRTFDNGDTDVVDGPVAVALSVGTKLTYCVGPGQLGLLQQLPTGRSLREYTVQLVDADQESLSREYRYVLNYDYQPYTRYFVYLSSLGVPETLATYGKGSAELNRFSEQAQTYSPTNYEIQDGQFEDYNLELQQSVEVTTGFRPKASLSEWNDFYRSPSRFYLTEGKAIPIGITSKSIQQAKDGDTLFAHKFAYVYLYRDEFYTDDPYGAVNQLMPQGFQGAGTILVQQQTIVKAIDDTIPDAVRNLTADTIQEFHTAAGRALQLAQAGFVTQQDMSLLFRRTDQKLDYHNDLTNQPTTRDLAGLTDVPTRAELAQGLLRSTFKVGLSSWKTTLEPK